VIRISNPRRGHLTFAGPVSAKFRGFNEHYLGLGKWGRADMKDFFYEFLRLLGSVPEMVTIAGVPNMPYYMQYNWWYDGIPMNGRRNAKGIPHQKIEPTFTQGGNE
jgi:hypothetical protein